MRRRKMLLGCLVTMTAMASVTGVGAWRQASAQSADWISDDVNGMHYEVLLPDHYKSSDKYPIILYLHQLDMGSYREGLLKQINSWFAIPAFKSRHPCIVVVPMLDQTNDPGGKLINFGGKRAASVGEENAIAALKQVIGRYHADTNRIYVTGNSMGGMGTWQMLLDYNAQTGSKEHIFAAGLPIAGAQRTADPAEAAKALAHVPIWSIHGAHDDQVSPDWDRAMARLMKDNPTFHYTEVSDAGHNVWDSYYTRSNLWDWLFAQHTVRASDRDG